MNLVIDLKGCESDQVRASRLHEKYLPLVQSDLKYALICTLSVCGLF